MEIGRGGSKGWGIRPRPVWFCLTSSPPHMTEKIFLPHPHILGPRKTPSPCCKTLLFVNLPITITIVFNQTCFVNKNILEITNKFILSNQFSFQKKLNNIIKMFNKAISQQKQKSQNTKSMIQQYINLFIIKTKENVKIGTLFPTLLEKKGKKKKSLVE